VISVGLLVWLAWVLARPPPAPKPPSLAESFAVDHGPMRQCYRTTLPAPAPLRLCYRTALPPKASGYARAVAARGGEVASARVAARVLRSSARGVPGDPARVLSGCGFRRRRTVFPIEGGQRSGRSRTAIR
jgi:hypothetical protein